MIIKVKAYGDLKDFLEINKNEFKRVEIKNNSSLKELIDIFNIPEEYINFHAFLVNGRYAKMEDDLSDGDRVVIIPVVGGG